MAGNNNFKVLATGVAANVLTQAEYEALTSLLANGFTAGVADSKTINKALRQSSFVASAVAKIIADNNVNALDDGDVATFKTNLLTAIGASLGISNAALKNALNAFTSGNYCAEKALPATTGNVTLDLATGVNYGGQLTGNITLVNPSNMQAGQSGILRIQNDAATPRTIAYGSYWKSPSGSMPDLTGVAGAVDVFGYYIESASRITLVQQADVK